MRFRRGVTWATMIVMLAALLGGALLSAPSVAASGLSWLAAANLPSAPDAAAVAAGPGGKIYAIGGGELSPSAAVSIYDPATNSWAAGPPLPAPRYRAGAAAGPDGTVYVFGGFIGGSNDATNTVLALAPGAMSWTTMAAMPFSAADVAVTAGANRLIYVAGGFAAYCPGACGSLANFAAYDTATNQWVSLPNLPTSVEGAAAVTAPNGKIYVVGGFTGGSQVGNFVSGIQVFDPAADLWLTINAPFATPRAHLGAAIIPDGTIYAIGGFGGQVVSQALNSVETFNIDSSTSWASGPSLQLARGFDGVVTGADGTIYAVGGDSAPITPTSTVEALPFVSLALGAPTSAAAGTAFDATVAATNLGGSTNPAFPLTVKVTSSDGSATLPSPLTFAAAGSQTVPVTVEALGAQTLSVTDVANALVTASASVTVSQQAQTIDFAPLPNMTYGVAPVTLSATASSGLPVSFSASGECSVAQDLATGAWTMTVTGAGNCSITATQPGNDAYQSAPSVTRSFTVAPATLKVTADNLSKMVGAPNPPLTYAITGFVNGDTSAVVSGQPDLTTTATMASGPGVYPIEISQGTLVAANYQFAFVNGTLTVGYRVCPQYDQRQAKHVGSTYPIVVTLCDGQGANLSSPSLTLHATQVTNTATGSTYPVQSPGNSQPGNNFRYTDGQYQFNLKTTGLPSGSYTLSFTSSGDPSTYTVGFAVK